MGRGIAWAAAVGGYRTLLCDVSADVLARARTEIAKDLDGSVERGKLHRADADAALARLETLTELGQAAAAADFAIEAVPEDMPLKLRTLAQLDQACRAEVVLASNTSGLSIAEMAAATGRPERVVGMHFFNPVPRMKLVEVVRALDTSEETVHVTVEVARRMGKQTVVVKESPGFLTSRVNALIGNEAFYMLQEGLASAEDIDTALKLGLNHPMGPFELVDLVGLDTRLAVLEHLHRRLGEKYRPSPLLVQYVKAGRLGRKAGRGVYDYRGGK
jgi:3-hydroxybutyryl-CoA dehydrogenase